MDKNTHAKKAQLRAISIYEKRPDRARDVNHGTAVVRDGLSCHYAHGNHHISMDMPAAIGGSDEGPSPGFFGRAAICGFLAIGIKMTAARESLELEAVRVEIEQDWDNRGVLGMVGASPVAHDTRIFIELESTEPERVLKDMVARALTTDPWFLSFRDAQPVSATILIAEEAA